MAPDSDAALPESRMAAPAPEPAADTPPPIQHADSTSARQEPVRAESRDGARVAEADLAQTPAVSASDDGTPGAAHRSPNAATAEAVLRDAQADYRRAIQAAQDAYAAGDAETAGFHIAQARKRRPDDPDVRRWETRIARLPDVLAARRHAANAHKAGDLIAERAAWRQVVALDPADVNAASRIREIDEQLQEQAFTQAIARGWRAVDENDPDRAGQALADAVQRKPRHAETRRLQTRIAALERTRARDRHLADAEQAAVRDDWAAALHEFEQAKALAPTHDNAVQGRALAARIVAAQRAMDEFLARPERLGSVNIAEAARKTLRDAEPLTAHSPRLKERGVALVRAVEVGQTPVPVRVLSDNQTEIGIQGVGVIGRTRERIITLLPGAYVFKGKREGYRSKLVEVAVRGSDGPPAEVRIICDERS